jgi:hypothetical protein
MKESWLCVDGHGDERIFTSEPYRKFPNMRLDVMWGQRWTTGSIDDEYRHGVWIPKGTIKHITGKELTYKDEPIKITEV